MAQQSASWNGAAWNQLGWNTQPGSASNPLISYVNPRKAAPASSSADADFAAVNPRKAEQAQ
jgi:hypothetical protein